MSNVNDHPLEWRGACPVSQRFDDIFFAVEDGLAETEYVFLHHNRLAERFSDADIFHVGELGFGTGLNFAACVKKFLELSPANARLFFSSIEKFPLKPQDFEKTLSVWKDLQVITNALANKMPEAFTPGPHRFEFFDGRIVLDLWVDDVQLALSDFSGRAVDAWFFDGFSPKKNPEMWAPEVFELVASHSHSETSFASYASAGFVRRNIEAAGFEVRKDKGFGRKREMIYGEMKKSKRPQSLYFRPPEVLVVGAGIVGCTTAFALAKRGVSARLIERENKICQKASGNPLAIVMPIVHKKPTDLEKFSWASFDYTRRLYFQLAATSGFKAWQPAGVITLLNDANRREKYFEALSRGWHSSHLSFLHSDSLPEGLPKVDAAWCPTGGFVESADLAEALISSFPNLIRRELNSNYSNQAQASTPLILCNAYEAKDLINFELTFRRHRGQVIRIQELKSLSHLKSIVTYGGYFCPAYKGSHLIGSTYDDHRLAPIEYPEDVDEIMLKAQNALGLREAMQVIDSRAGVRDSFRDGFPAAGLLHDHLALSVGFGSKAFTYSALAAEVVVGEMLREPLPVTKSILRLMSPLRFANEKTLNAASA